MPNTLDIRSMLLEIIANPPFAGSMQTNGVLQAIEKRLPRPVSTELAQAVLTQWHDLFRTGYLAWGLDFMNSEPPFFHLTEQGRRTLAQLSRDPGNPQGYLNQFVSSNFINPISMSYLKESLDCYVAGLHKASAVMIGAATESLILELRDSAIKKFELLGRPVPKSLNAWMIKTVMDGLKGVLDQVKNQFPSNMRDEYESYWLAFAQQIRSSRNDAGHPSSVEPITYESIHASLLIFPELAKLAKKLKDWIENDLV